MAENLTVRVDNVARLRALAAGLPHAAWAERVIPAPIDVVWGIAGDLQDGVPAFEHGVESVCVEPAGDDYLVVRARSSLGLTLRFRTILRPGWCVMQSRLVQIGMAAAEDRDRTQTHFGHFERIRHIGVIAKPLLRLKVLRELAVLERLALDRLRV